MSGRRLLLRSRIALITACVVATAIVGVSVITWFTTRHNLRAQVDQTLLEKPIPHMVRAVQGEPGPAPVSDLSFLCDTESDKALRQFVENIELLRANGDRCVPSDGDRARIAPADHHVTTATLRDGETESGKPVRLILRPLGNGDVLVFSRGLTDVEDTLNGLGNVLIALCFVGVAAAAATGLVLARRSLAPMDRLTKTAEHIARTEDLETTVDFSGRDVSGRDEVGRLGRAFASMTAALRESRHRQHRLVTDAAHELRTPLTSLRTNVDLLVRVERTGRAIPAARRERVLDRLQAQAEEFTDLVGELVELARDGTGLARDEVEMRTVIDKAVRRAASRSPAHVFEVDVTGWRVLGDATALERTVLNLLDNAIKFAPPSSAIAVRSGPGWLTVSDRGPGIPEHQRKQVFERFWRSPDARALPGSGLGLAIVATTAAAHGGTARFVDPPDGTGACARVELPAESAPSMNGSAAGDHDQ